MPDAAYWRRTLSLFPGDLVLFVLGRDWSRLVSVMEPPQRKAS